MIDTVTQKQTVFQTLISDYANYNYWANKQLADWLMTKPEEKIDQEIPSSFSSIRKTLLHMKDTQEFWLNVLREQQNIENEVSKGFDIEMSVSEVFDSIIDQSGVMASVIENYSEAALTEEVITITPWFESTQPRYELIQHCMNHSTYHRGQIITITRNLGITDAPMTDFNFYLLQVKG
ncbi:DinB family protein [Marivirga sp. S37H4]|uniref:DinB family protein n=1 Tax=Marivirga aurantiaca TaxID=2802615 RepID=A0A934WW47_9BACT|nr:DinB family protein [Marivirga aurantiaca]MBK6264047.1 DinB family protein [Marivirga aurantiaca]